MKEFLCRICDKPFHSVKEHSACVEALAKTHPRIAQFLAAQKTKQKEALEAETQWVGAA